MLRSFKALVKENLIGASPSNLKGSASIYDCVANKMVKDKALDYLCDYNKLIEVDIRDPKQLEEFCKLSLCIGLQLMFDHFGNIQPWLLNKFQQLGTHDRNDYTDLEKKLIMDAFLFQAIESGIILNFGNAKLPNFDSYILAARKYYKTLLGMGDRIAKTRVNNKITFNILLEEYWVYKLYQNENIQGQDKSLFRELVTRHMIKIPATTGTGAQAITDLMATHLITGEVFEYVNKRTEIYDYNIQDEYEIHEFCLSCISLGLHFFFDHHGNVKDWIKHIITRAGCKIGSEYTDREKKAILDGFLYQAVEAALVKAYEKADIPEFHLYRMMARSFIKKTIGCADKRTSIAENPEITLEILANKYRDILT